MEPELDSAEPPSAPRRAIGDALANENRQWVHQVNAIDAQSNPTGVVAYTPTESFQHRYARRLVARAYPTRRRTRSLPLPQKSLQPGQRDVPTARNVQNDQPRLEWLRRGKNSGVQKLRQAKDTTINKLRWIGDRIVPLVNNFRRRKGRNTFIGIGLGLLVALAYTNDRAAHYKALQATPVSLYISSFKSYPTWLHTDPLQVIGLPAQVDPAFFPSRRTIQTACRTYKSTWHTDLRKNRISERDALAIIHRGDLACDLLERYQDNQYCEEALSNITKFDVVAGYRDNPILLPVPSGFSSPPPGAPHFAKNCACTFAKYLRAWSYQVLMPVDLQPGPPKTLEETCPCTLDMATNSWQSFSFDAKSPQPPYLDRIKKDLSVLTTDWRVLWWRTKGLIFYDDQSFISREKAMACAQGTHGGCQMMEGWTSPSDFHPNLKACNSTVSLQESKDIKIEPEDDGIIEEEEWKQAREVEEKEREHARWDEESEKFLRESAASRTSSKLYD
ncbi:hypothetical protein HBI81_165910 [Parastagonospora nodorum]|nr:hypothetical protein HBH52_189260 [Parastagonospora nodorum]KAH3993924.1 hypothetical protein HBI10_194380 [Parastagonospora nodorum]KAH4008704.1 hypothetical protein HBI13_231590 [Parastagonospora nodorum]KAH4045117.1 hypothetical protein HBH49_205110 [Parastagonospora nodorum]KAH4062804.1 hypothetical protein HBH50_202390 [Parastagonospora nodorum]